MTLFTRRATLAAGSALLAAPHAVRAQGAPIRLGTLTPLTGAGGPYGPVMANCVRAVITEVNAAGGVLGRQIQLVSEDDQTNPEAGLRSARKLIDVDRVAAIMGTWASSVTTAVAPLCWESRTFLATVSGADSITALPHNGWLVRTQPNTTLQGRKFGEYAIELGARRAFFMAPQTPFTQSQFTNMKTAMERAGGTAELLVYDASKPSLRTEVDQALRFRPDIIVMGGYTPDTTVLLRDIFRAGYTGRKLAFAYSVNQQMLSALPNDVTEGIHTLAPSPAENSGGFARVKRIVGNDNPDPYTCQVYDHVNLVLMAMAAGRDGTGQAIRDSIRSVSQGGGEKVDNALDGLRAIAAGRKVDYDGASGPCDFTDAGDISDCQFRYEQVRAGRQTLLRIA
ncbi:ABC transporter substrate-binding protein [Roseomonas rosulenta]|uniref:ABC transporter substrate-binding protein n=1 Tax=Roseomonas rosulenta TaxID=2748667 RepID=UPI0018DF832F|nr:ABC transporter substrate-binding protein [Roseomonas rosulenta]